MSNSGCEPNGAVPIEEIVPEALVEPFEAALDRGDISNVLRKNWFFFGNSDAVASWTKSSSKITVWKWAILASSVTSIVTAVPFLLMGFSVSGLDHTYRRIFFIAQK